MGWRREREETRVPISMASAQSRSASLFQAVRGLLPLDPTGVEEEPSTVCRGAFVSHFAGKVNHIHLKVDSGFIWTDPGNVGASNVSSFVGYFSVYMNRILGTVRPTSCMLDT